MGIWSELCLNGNKGKGVEVLEIDSEEERELLKVASDDGSSTNDNLWVRSGGAASFANNGCCLSYVRSLARGYVPSYGVSFEQISIRESSKRCRFSSAHEISLGDQSVWA